MDLLTLNVELQPLNIGPCRDKNARNISLQSFLLEHVGIKFELFVALTLLLKYLLMRLQKTHRLLYLTLLSPSIPYLQLLYLGLLLVLFEPSLQLCINLFHLLYELGFWIRLLGIGILAIFSISIVDLLHVKEWTRLLVVPRFDNLRALIGSIGGRVVLPVLEVNDVHVGSILPIVVLMSKVFGLCLFDQVIWPNDLVQIDELLGGVLDPRLAEGVLVGVALVGSDLLSELIHLLKAVLELIL